MSAMLYSKYLMLFWIFVQVRSLTVDSKVEVPEKEEDATVALRMVKSAYEVDFAGLNKPVKVDCNQEGVICKFPLVEPKTRKSEKITDALPVFAGITVRPEASVKKEVSLVTKKEDQEEDKKVPILRGNIDVESLYSEDEHLVSISENHIPDKDPMNVYMRRFPDNRLPSVYFMYHSPYDMHDHIGAGPYQYPLVQPTYRWTPFFRPSVTRNPHVVSNTPCDPPVYSYPPPCSPQVRPTKKPVINIDDKIDN